MFAPDVFAPSLASRKSVNLQLDHDDGTVVASTTSGLELKETDLGLVFRLDLRRAKNASAIHSIVDGGNRACTSVAYRVEKEHHETYAGHKVRVITQAALQEISLCRRGVVEQAFCFISDSVCNPSIEDLHTTPMFALCRAQHNVRKATKAILENTAQLAARIDRLCERAGIGSSGMSGAATAVCSTIDRVVAGLQTLRV
jgi:HK97 family phage prohead protease